MLNATGPHLLTEAGRAVQVPCETGSQRDCAHASGKEALQGRGHQQGRHRRGRRLPGRDLSRKVVGCLAGTGTLSMAIQEDVPLDKRNVSYYSFHIYPVSTAGGAAELEQGSSGAMRRYSEICKASAMLRRLRMVGLRLPCSI